MLFNFAIKALLVSLFISAAATNAARLNSEISKSSRIPTGTLYGITTDDGYDVADLIDSTSSLPRKVVTRIVFDPWIDASEYLPGTTAIYRAGYVMGELLDSFSMKEYSRTQYVRRAHEYLHRLGNVVDIWEVGSEVNGEWLGPTSSVAGKIAGAFDVFKQAGKVTALTLYYNAGCSAPCHEMFAWANTNLPPRMKTGLDYVWVSYYEDDCLGLLPDWQAVFTRLRSMFPNSKLGIGEMGTTDPTAKQEMLARYYNLSRPGTITVPGFVGGYFYWFYRQDMVPKTNPLWAFFYDLLGGLP
ncbi:MAG: hypothetical protein RIQ81_311 [Pseudomonadota bacterium]|jgi:hypothetical protein